MPPQEPVCGKVQAQVPGHPAVISGQAGTQVSTDRKDVCDPVGSVAHPRCEPSSRAAEVGQV